MRRRSAALELTLLVVFVTTLLPAASSWVALRWQRSWLLAEVRRGLLLTCDALESSLRHAMMRNHREEIRAGIGRITRQTGVRQIRLVEHRGRITISTRQEDLGRRLEPGAPACALCHTSKGTRPRAPLDARARTVLEVNQLRALTSVLVGAAVPCKTYCAASAGWPPGTCPTASRRVPTTSLGNWRAPSMP